MPSFRRALALALLATVPAWAQTRLRWEDLKALATGERVEVFTPAGSVKGRCRGVTDRGIEVGRQAVSRADVERVRITRYVGSARKIGAGIGFVAGMVTGLIAFVAIGMDESGRDSKAVLTAKATSAWLGSWAGATLAGWLIGRQADREATEFRIIPEAAARGR